MSTKVSAFKKFVRELIRQELKDIEEASVTGNLDGGEAQKILPISLFLPNGPVNERRSERLRSMANAGENSGKVSFLKLGSSFPLISSHCKRKSVNLAFDRGSRSMRFACPSICPLF